MKLEKQISLNWKKYPVGFKLGKNPVHQTQYFKLENWKNPVQIDMGYTSKLSTKDFRAFQIFLLFQFFSLLETGYHDQNTANIKLGFDFIDKDKDGYLSFEELADTTKSNTRQGITDRLTNALASSHFETNGKQYNSFFRFTIPHDQII